MRASLVMVNYNGGRKAAGNAAVLAAQAAELGAEFVVVDNCSTDGSDELIREAASEARLVREAENRGYASAVNRGLEETLGDAFVVLNADVVPRPGALAALIEATLGGEYAILGGVLVDRRGRRSRNTARRLPRPLDIIREGLFLRSASPKPGADVPESPADDPSRAPSVARAVPVPVVSGAVMAVSRSALETLGPMDDEFFLYNEDVEWCRRAARNGLAVGLVSSAVFDHDGGESTRTAEGPAFAARMLSDFQYFCEGEGVAPEAIRRLWRVRLVLRALAYGAAARWGDPGRRDESRRRAGIYGVLAHDLRRFRWSVSGEGQNCHPSRLRDFPGGGAGDDPRPFVLHVIPNMEYGGAQRLVEDLVTGPLSERFRFEVLCLTHAGQIGEDLEQRGVPVHVVRMGGWRSRADWRLARDYAALLAPDLVHSHTLPGDAAAHFGFRGRAPRLSTKHSVDRWMSFPLKLAEAWILRGARVLCVSEATAAAKSYLDLWGMLPAVVQSPPAVRLADEPAPLMVEGRPVRLAVVGRLHRAKRVDAFIESAALLESRFPGRFDFSVVGDGPESGGLRSLASTLRMGERVEFSGAVSDVASELDRSDVVLLLSDYEGLGLTVLETLARGRIAVVRRTPGADESLPESLERCFVDSAEPERVVEKVLEIADAPDEFAALAQEGRAWVGERGDQASTMDGVYREMLPGERGTRVLHLITRLIVGGAQENTIASVARVAPDRHESHLWTGCQTGSEGSLMADARSRGVCVRVLPRLVREIAPLGDLVLLVQLTRLIRRGRFDIVHTHSSKAGIVGRVAARLAGVQHIVHTLHGWGFHDHMHPALRAFYVFAERAAEPWTHPLVSVSETTTAVGLAAGIGRPEDYRLIRSGIPLGSFHPDDARRAAVREQLGVARDDVVIGSVGRLSPQKNPLHFVLAAEKLAHGRDRVRFVYIGDGPLRDEVEHAAAQAGVADRLVLTGIRRDVPDLLRAMDVFVLTSLWEGLPRVVLQALATGLPVVAYDTAGIKEAVVEGRNGHLVARGDLDGLVGRLASVIDDPELRRRMSDAAVDELDRSFTEDAMIEQLEDLYAELVGSGRLP